MGTTFLFNALQTFATALSILDFDISKTVDNTLLEIPVFNLNRNMPKDVPVLLAGVFLMAFATYV